MDDKIKIGQRIKEKRKEKRLTQEQLGGYLGMNKSTIQRYETGKVDKIKLPVLENIAFILDVNPSYLALKTDDPCYYGEKTSMPGSLIGECELTSPLNSIPVDASDFIQIPVLGSVAAGVSCHCEDNIIGYETVQKSILCSGEEYVYLLVKGDSMSPMLSEGDYILVRCQSSVDSGDYAVVIIDGEDGVVKQVKYDKDSVTLISINPYYPPRTFRGDEELSRLRVFGKLIESKRKY